MTEGQGAAAVQVTRDKTNEEFTEIENNRELADIQEELFDEYERFRAIGNLSIHDYFVPFYKLINDIKITQLDIHANQMNTKFINNLPPYWEKYVTNVKNNKDISATTYVELYTYLKSYEPHAMKTLKKQEQSSSIVDPLAYLALTTHHLMPTQPTNPPPSTSLLTLPPQPAAQSSNDAMLATMNQIVNLLSGFQKQFPATKNQLRTSSNSRSHATVHDKQIFIETVQRKAPGNVGNTGTRVTQSYGQVTDNKGSLVISYNYRGEGYLSRQCKEKVRVKDSQYFKDKMLLMEAKEKGAVLDAEAEAFLADVECTTPYDQPLTITNTNIFKVSHEDAYDSDVDEGPHAAAAFMANLSSTSGTNGATTSHVNEVSSVSPGEISMITILDDLRNQLDGHLKVNQEQSMVNDSLRAELARCSNLWYAKQAKIAQPTLYDGHALLKPTNTPVRVHDSEESLVQAEVSRIKMSNRPGTIKPINYAELNSLYSHFVPQKELSREQVYWLPAEELTTQKSNPPKLVTLFVQTRPAPSKAFTEQVIPFYEHVKELVQSLDENLVKEVTEFMRIFDELDKEYEQCVLEKTKLQIEKKNLLIQNECLITDFIAKDICSIVLASDKDRPLSEKLRSNCVRENSKVIELEAEILKQQQMLAESDKRCSFIQKNHIDLYIKFRNYKEYLKNQTLGDNSHSPTVNAVFEINQLKKQLQVKDDTIRKLQTQINNMSMLNVEPTVGVKPGAGASKPMSKSDTRNDSTFPAKRGKVRRVKDHHRNLNKQNHVHSRLNVKRIGFVSNSNTVYNACNESLVFANHDNCVVCNLKSVNVKTPTAKHNMKTTQKVWKAKVVTVRSQWKPTGRRFTLYVEYPLTRIVKPIVEPLELTLCISSNSKVTMIFRFTDYKLSNRKAGTKGIFGSSIFPLVFRFRMLSAYDR
nr:hypothetical protein [Tanacetum cinerariifolium]